MFTAELVLWKFHNEFVTRLAYCRLYMDYFYEFIRIYV